MADAKESEPSARLARILVTASSLVLLVIRVIWPELGIDPVSLALLAFAVLPWLSTLIKSAEIPGGWKVEFQEVKVAGDRVTAGALTATSVAPPTPSYVVISDRDPNLAVVGLRIEIEKRLNALAERVEVDRKYNLRRMSDELLKRGILDAQEMRGLSELIEAGNAAAHGALVSPQAARWAIERGPDVLAILDAKLAQMTGPLSN